MTKRLYPKAHTVVANPLILFITAIYLSILLLSTICIRLVCHKIQPTVDLFFSLLIQRILVAAPHLVSIFVHLSPRSMSSYYFPVFVCTYTCHIVLSRQSLIAYIVPSRTRPLVQFGLRFAIFVYA